LQFVVSLVETLAHNFRNSTSARFKLMKLESCFARKRAQIKWFCIAWICAAASAAASGCITVVQPSPVI